MLNSFQASYSWSKAGSRVVLGALLLLGGVSFAVMGLRADSRKRTRLEQDLAALTFSLDWTALRSLTREPATVDGDTRARLGNFLIWARDSHHSIPEAFFLVRDGRDDLRVLLSSDPVWEQRSSVDVADVSSVAKLMGEVLDTGTGGVAGPFSTPAGPLVAVATPIADPSAGEIMAVFGVYRHAGNWWYSVASAVAIPAGLLLALLIVLAAAIWVKRKPSEKPVLRLFIPLAMILFVLALSTALMLQDHHRRELVDELARRADAVREDFDRLVRLQEEGLAGMALSVAHTHEVAAALARGDVQALRSIAQPVYEQLAHEADLTHFSFLAPAAPGPTPGGDAPPVSRYVLRLHAPERRGDSADEYVVPMAREQRKVAHGFELDSEGYLSLRVVTPVWHDGEMVGFVQMGRILSRLLRRKRPLHETEIAVLVSKEKFSREAYDHIKQVRGDEPHWNELPETVVMFTSWEGGLPGPFLEIACQVMSPACQPDTFVEEITFDGRHFRTSSEPLLAANGEEQARLLAMHETTSYHAAFQQRVYLGVTLGGVLLVLMLAALYVLLRRTEEGVRAARERLAGNEALLAATLNSIGDGVISCDSDGLVVIQNEVASSLMGWSAAEACGRPVEEVFSIQDAAGGGPAELPVLRAIETGRTFSLSNDTLLVARDGQTRPIADSCAPIRDAEGEVAGAVLVFRDVTEEYRQRAALKESEARFDLAVRGANDGIWGWDRRSGELYLSPRWKSQLGYEDAELENELATFERLLHDEDRDRARSALRRFFREGGATYEFEFRLIHKDGSVRWILARGAAIRDETGRVVRIAGSHTDITERKADHEALVNNKQYIESLLNSIPDMLFVFSRDGRFVDYKGAERSLLAPPDEFIGRTIRDLLPAELGQRMEAAFETLFERGGVVELDYALSVTDELRHYASRMARLGEAHILGVTRDVTDQVRMRGELEAAKIQAEAANSAKSEFLANMSHELRTPMNSLLGMTELLLDSSLTDDQRRSAEVIQSSGRVLLRLLNDILDLSKVEANRLELERVEFDLVELVDELFDALAVQTRGKSVALLCGLAPDLPDKLVGDPVRLRQVLNNLLGNALKFTESGEVVLEADLLPTAEPNDQKVEVRFVVKDTGIGIPEEKLGLLFQNFYQVDPSTTRRYGGSGLGLAISRRLVELMGGTIRVESTPGEGSKFSFTTQFALPQRERPVAQSPPPLDGARVLVVDESATGRAILTRRLAYWGASVRPVSGGLEALDELSRVSEGGAGYDVILVDWELSEPGGQEWVWSILASARLAATPLVILTPAGHDRLPDVAGEQALPSYVKKPISARRLRQAVEDALSGAQPASAATDSKRPALPSLAERRANVLVAEDNPANQEVAAALLSKLGVACEVCGNGEEALAAHRERRFDLVLMDIQMPKMDGVETTRCIRAQERARGTAAVPIIAMTAHTNPTDREIFIAAGMDDHIAKPVSAQTLAAVLDQWLALQGATAREPSGEAHHAGAPKSGLAEAVERDSSAADGAPVFDRAGLLARLMGDEELLASVAARFLPDMAHLLSQLDAALEAQDALALARHAHALKGSAATVGGQALSLLAGELERCARDGRLDAAQALRPKLDRAAAGLCDALENGNK